MLTRNGSCVIRIVNTSAGSNGRRRRPGRVKGSPPFPLGSAASAAAASTVLALDRARRDLLALAERRRVLRRAGDHAREQLRAAVADVLELRDADVLHAR